MKKPYTIRNSLFGPCMASCFCSSAELLWFADRALQFSVLSFFLSYKKSSADKRTCQEEFPRGLCTGSHFDYLATLMIMSGICGQDNADDEICRAKRTDNYLYRSRYGYTSISKTQGKWPNTIEENHFCLVGGEMQNFLSPKLSLFSPKATNPSFSVRNLMTLGNSF